jgi:hypothetical protein
MENGAGNCAAFEPSSHASLWTAAPRATSARFAGPIVEQHLSGLQGGAGDQ